MIQSIHIKNFQSHQNTRLEFNPGLNAILGVSDSGKSAILRALHWVRDNRPMGDGHISKWAKSDKGKLIEECSVTVQTQGGPVSRIRSPEFNGYKVGELSFEAVRSDVPQEVSDAFNMGEVNVQKQLDAPFLLSKSPSEVSRFFNSVVNLEEMGQLMCAAERERLDLKKESKKAEKDSEALGKKIEALAWIDLAKVLVGQAESLDNYRDKLILKRASLQTLQTNANAYLATIGACKPIVDLGLLVEEAGRLVANLTIAKLKKTKITLAQSQILQAKVLIDDCSKLIANEAHVTKAKNLIVHRETFEKSKEKLCMLHSQVLQFKVAMSNFSEIASKEHLIPHAKASLENLSRLRQDKARLSALQTQAEANASLLKSLSVVAERGPQEQKARELAQELARLTSDKQKLTLTKVKLQMYERTVNEKRAEIAELEANLPKACPTCGQLVIHKH